MESETTLNLALQTFFSSSAHALDLVRLPPTDAGCHESSSASDANSGATVFIVDDNRAVRESMRDLLQENGYQVEVFADGLSFLNRYRAGRRQCAVIDVQLPGMSGIELIERLHSSGHGIPVIVVSGNATVPIAVKVMKAGATDFIEKPVRSAGFLASIKRALDDEENPAQLSVFRKAAALSVTRLTLREQQVLGFVLAGQSNKKIAGDLGISQRAVEAHRAAIMRKTGSRSLSELIRKALYTGSGQDDRSEAQRSNQNRQFGNWRRLSFRSVAPRKAGIS
jgi:two-component system CheB/CheR fusion protein